MSWRERCGDGLVSEDGGAGLRRRCYNYNVSYADAFYFFINFGFGVFDISGEVIVLFTSVMITYGLTLGISCEK